MATPVLEMRNVEKNFGGVRAIDNFSVTLEPGKIHGLIGPNGAGKTTIFNNITGIYAPDSGKIIFNGTDITGSAPHRVAQLGIGRTLWVPSCSVAVLCRLELWLKIRKNSPVPTR